MAEELIGDFVHLRAVAPQLAADTLGAAAVEELPAELAEPANLRDAITDGRLGLFDVLAVPNADRSPVLAHMLMIGGGDGGSEPAVRLAVIPRATDPTLEQLEDAFGLALAHGFATMKAKTILLRIDPEFARYIWILLRFGFEWTEDDTKERLGRTALVMRRKRFAGILPWGAMSA